MYVALSYMDYFHQSHALVRIWVLSNKPTKDNQDGGQNGCLSECDNVLQPSPIHSLGCNTSHLGLANVNTWKRMFYSPIKTTNPIYYRFWKKAGFVPIYLRQTPVSRNCSIVSTFTLDRRQSKTPLTIDERGSKISKNSVFD